MERDQIDVILEQWQRERPDLDLTSMSVFGRIAILARLLENRTETVYTAHGLRQGEFDVLTALRRSGPPYTLMPSELAGVLMMSRAGMTNRIDRLAAAGLVERTLDPEDRRSFRITLTGKGRTLIDETMTDHAANLDRLASALPPAQLTELADNLTALLKSLQTAG